jgi:hypothetical protein
MGGAKYKTIQSFTFIGFKNQLPVGVIKSLLYGWGFTKLLKPFLLFIEENLDIERIIIEKGGKIQLDKTNKVLYLSEVFLATLNKTFDSSYRRYKNEVSYLLQTHLHSFFPANFSRPVKTYLPNTLATSLLSWGNSIEEFFADDKAAISSLFDKLSVGSDFLSKDSLMDWKKNGKAL